MPVIPCRSNLFQSYNDLYEFISVCQERFVEKKQPQIVSITVEIDPVDPLAVLHKLATSDQPHFYFENRLHEEAIAAVGSVRALEISGTKRFSQVQFFINSCLENIISTDDLSQPLSNPHFFCSFTFFDQPSSISPFPAATVFLPRWQIVRRQDHCNAIANLVISSHLNIENVATELWQGLQTIRSARHGLLSDPIRQPFQQWKTTEIHNFKASVVSALQSIYANQLSKVVLAHEVDVLSPVAFRWLHSLHNLRQRHPDCYIFSTSNGKGQSFIGASPERLISIRDRTLITDALAGSAPRGKTVEEDVKLGDRLLSSDKERHEHRVVVDFMIHQLQQFGLSPRWAAIPTLRRLSNIQHLHTPIQATVLPNLDPLQILAELHPTPAVAGMSRDLACQYIRRHEPFERSLYAAPLGWVDAQGNAEFIVGIRSALLEGHRARLYAGAGIVAGSNPDRELAEVKLKLQALLQALV